MGVAAEEKTTINKTANGAISFKARLASIGVYEYADGQFELRSPEEVKKSVDSFKNRPLKMGHEGMNCPNAGTTIGSLGNDLEFDGVYIVGTVNIDKQIGIDAYNNGMRFFSCEYTCDLEEKEGRFLGANYNYVQTNIRGKACAIVDAARGGETLTKADGCMARTKGHYETRGDRLVFCQDGRL